MAGFSLGSWLLGSSEGPEAASTSTGFSLSSIWGNSTAPAGEKSHQQEAFHCFACDKTFTNTKGLRPPKCLPCGHFVCRPCVESVTSLSGARLCPLASCKKLIIGDADRQPLAFSLLNILEKSGSELTDLAEDQICLQCKEDVATGYCSGCSRAQYMCGPCGIRVHEPIEASGTPAQKAAHKPQPLLSPSICRTHVGMILRHFCERCLQMVCDICLKQSHSYCTRWILTMPLNEKDAVRLLETLEKQLPGLAKLYPQLTEARDEIAGLQASVTRRCELSAANFTSLWHKWEAALQERKKELDKALAEIYERRKTHIKGQTNCVAVALHSVETSRSAAGYAVSEQGLSAEGNMLRILLAIQQSAQLLKLTVKVDAPLLDFGFVANGDESMAVASLGRALDVGVEEGKEPGELFSRIKPVSNAPPNLWALPKAVPPVPETPEPVPAASSKAGPGTVSTLAEATSTYLLAAVKGPAPKGLSPKGPAALLASAGTLGGGASVSAETGATIDAGVSPAGPLSSSSAGVAAPTPGGVSAASSASSAAAPVSPPRGVGGTEVDVSQCLAFGRAVQGLLCGRPTELFLVLCDSKGVPVNLLRVADVSASLKLSAATASDPRGGSRDATWGAPLDVSLHLDLDVEHAAVGVYRLAFTPPYLGVWAGETSTVALEILISGSLVPVPLLRAVRVRQPPLPGCVIQHMARGRSTWFANAAVTWQQGRVVVMDVSGSPQGGPVVGGPSGQAVVVHEAPRAGGQVVRTVAAPADAKRVLLATAPPPSPIITAAASSRGIRSPVLSLNDAGDRFVLATVTETACEVSLASLSGAPPVPWVRFALDVAGDKDADMAAVTSVAAHPRGTLLVLGRGGLVRFYGWVSAIPTGKEDASPAAKEGEPAKDTPWKHQMNLANVLPNRIPLSLEGGRAVLLPDGNFAVLLVEKGGPESEGIIAGGDVLGADVAAASRGGSSSRLACVFLSPDSKVMSTWVISPPVSLNFSAGIEAAVTHSGDLVVAVAGSGAVLVLSAATGAVKTAFEDSQDLESGFDRREMPKGACVVRYHDVRGKEGAEAGAAAGRGPAAGEDMKRASLQYGLQVCVVAVPKLLSKTTTASALVSVVHDL